MITIAIVASFLLCCQVCFSQTLSGTGALPFVQEKVATQPVRTDPDDPAIWIYPGRPELSVIVGTDKAATIGGLYAFDLNGSVIQHIDNIDRPNNVDVEYGFRLNASHSIDLIVLTERIQTRLRVFSIHLPARHLYEIPVSNPKVFTDSVGEQAAPMGISLYKRPSDGTIYAIVSRKSGPARGYLGQYELLWNQNAIELKFIRYFGDFQGTEIESVVVDDQLGFAYYSDEGYGIRKYHVDPSTTNPEQIGFINTTNLWQGDSEGLAVYSTSDTHGYLVITDQVVNGSRFHLYERHGSNAYLKTIATRADQTDGIEVTSASLGANFPRGLLVTMNEHGRNFLLFDWRDIDKALGFISNGATKNQYTFTFVLLVFVGTAVRSLL